MESKSEVGEQEFAKQIEECFSGDQYKARCLAMALRFPSYETLVQAAATNAMLLELHSDLLSRLLVRTEEEATLSTMMLNALEGLGPDIYRGQKAVKTAKSAIDARHSKPGGSREKRAAIHAAWASGKYSSRDICAEQECGGLDMSFSAARKALRGTTKPTWPLHRIG